MKTLNQQMFDLVENKLTVGVLGPFEQRDFEGDVTVFTVDQCDGVHSFLGVQFNAGGVDAEISSENRCGHAEHQRNGKARRENRTHSNSER